MQRSNEKQFMHTNIIFMFMTVKKCWWLLIRVVLTWCNNSDFFTFSNTFTMYSVSQNGNIAVVQFINLNCGFVTIEFLFTKINKFIPSVIHIRSKFFHYCTKPSTLCGSHFQHFFVYSVTFCHIWKKKMKEYHFLHCYFKNM